MQVNKQTKKRERGKHVINKVKLMIYKKKKERNANEKNHEE